MRPVSNAHVTTAKIERLCVFNAATAGHESDQARIKQRPNPDQKRFQLLRRCSVASLSR